MKTLMLRLAISAGAALLALMMVHIALLLFALGIYVALESFLGPAGALLVSAAIYLGFAALCVLLLRGNGKTKKTKAGVPATTATSSLMSGLTGDVEDFVRRHPAGVLGASFVAGVLAARSPTTAGRLMRGFMMMSRFY